MRNVVLISRYQKSEDTYLRRFVARITRLGRNSRLRHQFGEIEQRSLALPRANRAQLAELIARECDNVAAAPDPALYGSRTASGDVTSGLDIGFSRASSENVQVRVRGLALWIALVYQETLDATAPDARELHRNVLHIMRTLKVFSARSGGSAEGRP